MFTIFSMAERTEGSLSLQEAGVAGFGLPGVALLNGVSGKERAAGQVGNREDANALSSQRTVPHRWRLYIFEGVELALFMVSACLFTVILFLPSSPAVKLLPDQTLRRLLMGMSMGVTAVLIIHSPMGKRSGAHFNPAITLTYFRLGKISRSDAFLYVIGQFIGGVAGVGVSDLVLGEALASPSVMFAITVPGKYGTGGAFAAEAFMAALLMGVVLWTSNRPAIAFSTSYLVGILIAFYVLLFAPVSGFSINPARTTASAVFAGVWTAVWLYFTAPVLGMLFAAEAYLRSQGRDRILCAKLHPDNSYECPFLCHYPGHHPGHYRSAVEKRVR
jgi:aquaporin Z